MFRASLAVCLRLINDEDQSYRSFIPKQKIISDLHFASFTMIYLANWNKLQYCEPPPYTSCANRSSLIRITLSIRELQLESF